MRRAHLAYSVIACLCLLSFPLGFASTAAAEPHLIKVYKTPTCGCCTKWVDHLKEHGFEVETVEMKDLRPLKLSNGVPTRLASCHTAFVEGYIVEGHVPAQDVIRLLEERPPLAGLAVPGMPIGSPGMEGRHPEHYTVLGFDNKGGTTPFASHGP